MGIDFGFKVPIRFVVNSVAVCVAIDFVVIFLVYLWRFTRRLDQRRSPRQFHRDCSVGEPVRDDRHFVVQYINEHIQSANALQSELFEH